MSQGKIKIKFTYKFSAGVLVFFGTFLAAMLFGAVDVSIKDVWLAMISNSSDKNISILREIRFPREIAAIFVGAALAVSGTIMQGITRNPLADPGLLGLTSGSNAALALTIAMLPTAGYLGITLACFAGAAIGMLLVLIIGSGKNNNLSPLRVVLAGAAVSAMLTAVGEGIGIVFKISKEISMWTAGGLMGTSWSQLKIVVPFILTGIFISILLSRQLTILSLSEEVAVGLGQKTVQVKLLLLIVIILLAGSSVALAGNMVFIGLMIPHVVRAIVGIDYRFIIPMSAVAGSTFMLLADTLGRTINAPYETPVAAVVAVIGLPFFLFIVHKGGRSVS